MDRRSRLWQRKSSDKSSGETESSGSISSHSERFSDDQAFPTHSIQSLEVTSKAPRSDEELNESVGTLKEKLSAALLDSNAKDELVKQHAKVAEEAVSGWEKSENEVLGLKQQLEATNQKNSALKDRVGHLDGALKECVRQLRQAREDQDRNTNEVVAKKTREWDSSKSILESQLADLQAQLQAAKTEAAASIGKDLRLKLEATEKENSALKLSLRSRVKELEIATIERDLSTQAAEAASKQHLESIKKVVKLEAECRRLNALARKALPDNGHKSFSTSSVYVESFIDSQSDSGERVLAIELDTDKASDLEPSECDSSQSNSRTSARITDPDKFNKEKGVGKNLMVPSVDINLMDDFLEMERFAATPVTKNKNCYLEAGLGSNQCTAGKNLLETELETMIQRTAELEGKLEKMVTEKVELEMTMTECEKEIQTLKSQLLEADLKLEDLQTQLNIANGSRYASDEEVKACQTMREVAESQLRSVQTELDCLILKVGALEEDVSKERALSAENEAKCQKVENELLIMKHEAELQRMASTSGDLKIQQEKELALAASKFAECQKTIASLGQQLKSLATLEDILMDSDRPSDLIDEALHS
ncbi:putative filament-like plant protein [Rosa chinensis]|uniref:Putative filament-like plant protein n=1 Tax=Rosa chinensis TaxID=74649 RepID=A0A2P6RT31_ROSCH|nr:filament-like plant protein [Rosa chinensis]XP_024184373.1 filament-like plant protein [Rosa chinensis]XP_040370524.1 filament-like plant protein [Rosa chinensis]PRQ49593.1 putative filament-like plant protein [Rosa chinensis]